MFQCTTKVFLSHHLFLRLALVLAMVVQEVPVLLIPDRAAEASPRCGQTDPCYYHRSHFCHLTVPPLLPLTATAAIVVYAPCSGRRVPITTSSVSGVSLSSDSVMVFSSDSSTLVSLWLPQGPHESKRAVRLLVSWLATV